MPETTPETTNSQVSDPETSKDIEPKRSWSPGHPKYDWLTIRREYVEGYQEEHGITYPTLQELATKYGVPHKTVRMRSAKERWRHLRAQHLRTIEAAKRAKRAIRLGEEAADFDTKSLNVAKLGIAMVTQRMAEIAKDVREREELKAKFAEDLAAGRMPKFDIRKTAGGSVIDARELDTLARAGMQWFDLGKKAMGEATERTETTISIDVEETVNVTSTLMMDDAERMAAFLEAAIDSGVINADLPKELRASMDHETLEDEDLAGDAQDTDDTEVHDAEIVEDE